VTKRRQKLPGRCECGEVSETGKAHCYGCLEEMRMSKWGKIIQDMQPSNLQLKAEQSRVIRKADGMS
jgi:hypothetical protein